MVVLKSDPAAVAAAAAVAAEVADAAEVATAVADNNQQRAAKTVTAEIAVGKRRQARGEKRWQGRRRRRGRGVVPGHENLEILLVFMRVKVLSVRSILYSTT